VHERLRANITREEVFAIVVHRACCGLFACVRSVAW
jgi:hypothetical protein